MIKLTAMQVQEIRRRYTPGKAGGVKGKRGGGGVQPNSMRSLAQEFNVTVPTVHYVIHRRTWAIPE